MRAASKVGADVPFLCSYASLALAQGAGELVTPLKRDLSALLALVVIPEWRCQTPEMYKKADAFYAGVWPKNVADAQDEAASLLVRLCSGEFCGLLPNDFTPVLLNECPQYQELFQIFERQRAVAWGISGSGSAAFALWREAVPRFEPELPWIEDTYIFPLER